MWEKDEYFKDVSVTKVAFIIGLILGLMVIFAGIARAEDNKTINNPTNGFPKIIDDDRWSSQLVYDTLGACYQGTIKWVILSNPSLLGQAPGPMAMRQMMEHCFCVMDKIRKENKVKDYQKKVLDPEWGGNLFMLKAMECVKEYKTLPSFFTGIIEIPSDNETKKEKGETNNPEDSQEESPDQPKEESEGSPQTIFQG